MDSKSLKPCPFCGKKVKFTYYTGDYGYTPDTVSIECCGTKITAATQGWEKSTGHFDCKEAARQEIAAKWNTRIRDEQKE